MFTPADANVNNSVGDSNNLLSSSAPASYSSSTYVLPTQVNLPTATTSFHSIPLYAARTKSLKRALPEPTPLTLISKQRVVIKHTLRTPSRRLSFKDIRQALISMPKSPAPQERWNDLILVSLMLNCIMRLLISPGYKVRRPGNSFFVIGKVGDNERRAEV